MLKKMLCLVSVAVFLFSLAPHASATGTESVSAYSLEAYMNLSSAGLIEFDAEQAIADGFPNDMVTRHQDRINFMNGLVLDGITTISADYKAVVYYSRVRNGDNTYVEYNPWGYTVYLSKDDTDAVVSSLPSDKTLSTLASLFGLISLPAKLTTYGLIVYHHTIINAASHNRGIYFQVYDDGTTATPLCIVGPR